VWLARAIPGANGSLLVANIRRSPDQAMSVSTIGNSGLEERDTHEILNARTAHRRSFSTIQEPS
jgi:hypothetical protein